MTFENDTFESFKDARRSMLGEGDSFRYYNPETGRPIKKLKKYTEVVLYGENTHFGYKSMAQLKKIAPNEVIVRKELFDQSGDFKTFNDMWEAFKYYTDFQR